MLSLCFSFCYSFYFFDVFRVNLGFKLTGTEGNNVEYFLAVFIGLLMGCKQPHKERRFWLINEIKCRFCCFCLYVILEIKCVYSTSKQNTIGGGGGFRTCKNF